MPGNYCKRSHQPRRRAYAPLMASRYDGVADPDDPRWGDQDRDVGDGSGQPRVRPSDCLTRLAQLMAVAVVWLLGLALAVAVVTLWVGSSLGGALVGILITLATAAVVAVWMQVRLTPGPPHSSNGRPT